MRLFLLTLILSLQLVINGLSSQKRIVVVGGGAAGYFSAIQAAATLDSFKRNAEVNDDQSRIG